jgi:murein L,D-transpeptidase YcbB/YkuD
VRPRYLRGGPNYLKASRYEILSDWSHGAAPVDPATIDWNAVATSAIVPRVRQLPGIGNSMGVVKFNFGNDLGIYLHDTPEKALMLKAARQLSSGCIRLEDARRLGRWLNGGTDPARSTAPEHDVALPRPVPVYVTYLTAQSVGAQIVLGPDPYRRDTFTVPAVVRQGPVDSAAR